MKANQFRLLHWADEVLHNDEASSDLELMNLFEAHGFSEIDAKCLIAQRQKCLTDPYYAAWIRMEPSK